jgi:hypothetical protein
MLLRFEVSNHRSIMEPVELSMIAVDEDRPAARAFDLLNERVLAVAGLYGPNASGKSNVLDSLSWLAAAVGRSLRQWEDFIPRDSFKFGMGPDTPSTFEIEMMVTNVRYVYTLEVDNGNVLFEGLYSYPRRVRRTLFEREGTDFSLRRGLGALSGTRDLLTPTTLALSAAMRFDEPEVRTFARSLANIAVLETRYRPFRRLGRPGFGPFGSARRYATEQMFFDGPTAVQPDLFDASEPPEPFGGRESALALLRFADLGIDDVEVVEELVEEAEATQPYRRRRLRLIHRVKDQQLPFELGDESDGTQTWFKLIGPVLRALRAGQLVLFDEIDASLHPRLSARLIELFHDPETNPRGAQLVFTSHDTSLLNHLNRDEVWLTEKSAQGATALTALAEYGGEKVRRSLNIERAYLQGRFGAVPELDQYLLRRALGLVSA